MARTRTPAAHLDREIEEALGRRGSSTGSLPMPRFDSSDLGIDFAMSVTSGACRALDAVNTA